MCHSYGCRTRSLVELSDENWTYISAPLQQSYISADEERKSIARFVARFERVAGEKTGTSVDVGGATMRGHGFYQLDCIDETVNTAKYLNFAVEQGLLQFHDVVGPARRGAFIDGEWPHNTAVVQERETGQFYVIDSWFFDNGEKPSIVPLEIWLDGWRPEGV